MKQHQLEITLDHVQQTDLARRKRYRDRLLIKGSEVRLNSGNIVDASWMTDLMISGSAPVKNGMYEWWKMIWEKTLA